MPREEGDRTPRPSINGVAGVDAPPDRSGTTMLMVIPIRTESAIRRAPQANYLLIAANALLFILFSESLGIERLITFKTDYLAFQSDEPAIYQFITYQFLHADVWHLVGNMLFLWVFGNSVNSKMGHVPYVLFYLAGGVFAAWGFGAMTPGPAHLIGASGSIAAVTTAYLALFPRSRVTVLLWFFLFIHFIEVPAMILILLKIIVWDNVVAPQLGVAGSVAHGAHLAGYLFGFAGALVMLLIRALPRDQFDILALWKRWHQRREFRAAMKDPAAAARAQFGSVAQVASADPRQRAEEDRRFSELMDLRAKATEAVELRNPEAAGEYYRRLLNLDSKACLPERHQLEVGREYYSAGRLQPAATAFERFVECYPNSSEADNVRLLVGIIYARDLRKFEAADRHLTQSMETLRDETRRQQCLQWLRNVRAALGRPAPGT